MRTPFSCPNGSWPTFANFSSQVLPVPTRRVLEGAVPHAQPPLKAAPEDLRALGESLSSRLGMLLSMLQGAPRLLLRNVTGHGLHPGCWEFKLLSECRCARSKLGTGTARNATNVSQGRFPHRALSLPQSLGSSKHFVSDLTM